MKLLLAILLFLIGIGLWLANAWLVMIALGIAHGEDARVPAFGFWTTVLLVWAVSLCVELALGRREMSKAAKR